MDETSDAGTARIAALHRDLGVKMETLHTQMRATYARFHPAATHLDIVAGGLIEDGLMTRLEVAFWKRSLINALNPNGDHSPGMLATSILQVEKMTSELVKRGMVML